MIKPYLLPILLSLSYSGGILAQDSNHESPFISSTQASAMAISATTGFMVAASQSATVYEAHTHGVGQYTALKGAMGEAVMDKLLSNHLKDSGNWQRLAKLGPQGIDSLYVKLDPKGLPKDLLVAEAKFGTSRLGNTVDGCQQMSHCWTSKRLKTTASYYRSNRQPQLARFLEAAADGKIRYRANVSRLSMTNRQFTMTMTPVKVNYSNPTQVFLNDSQAKSFQLRPPLVKTAFSETIAEDLFKHSPARYPTRQLALTEARQMVKVASEKGQLPKLINYRPQPQVMLNQTLNSAIKPGLGLGAGLGGGIELLTQLASGQPVDGQRVVAMALLGEASRYAGTFAGMAMQQTLLKNEAQLLFKLVMPKTFSPGLSGFTGGLMAGAVFSYGAYLMGYTTLAQAHQSMAMNLATMALINTVATPLAIAGLTSLAGTLGVTAGTGTAIASLGGAAATNATLAWVGGGTLASGGLGVAGGTAMIFTGVGAIVVGITVIGGGIFYLADQQAERERVGYLLAKVKNRLEQPG